jgi:hypothetical protein
LKNKQQNKVVACVDQLSTSLYRLIYKHATLGAMCWQANPIAPYLFISYAEIFAILIKKNKDIKGIHVKNTEHKISQYADDSVLRYPLMVHPNHFLQH